MSMFSSSLQSMTEATANARAACGRTLGCEHVVQSCRFTLGVERDRQVRRPLLAHDRRPRDPLGETRHLDLCFAY
jgi:hypothetical protein